MLKSWCALIVLSCGVLHATTVNIINPSFELDPSGNPLSTGSSLYSYDPANPPYGWTVWKGNIEVVDAAYWPAEDGQWSVDMNGTTPGGIQQVINGLTPGQPYQLTFGLSANVSWCNGPGQDCLLEVKIGGVTQDYTVNLASPVWTDETIQFTPTAASAILSFEDQTTHGGSGGPAIDNVRISYAAPGVPEPASVTLVLLGAGALVLAGRRRRLVS
jgi:hypothetical protein